MKRLIIFIALLLAACGASRPALTPEMTTALNARADLYDMEYPGGDINVARQCVTEPLGLYWHEDGQIWAVICELPALPGTYGAVLMDRSYMVIRTEHVNAKSLGALEDLVFSVGWEER